MRLRSFWALLLLGLAMAIAGLPAEAADSSLPRRRVVSLDGVWQIAEGSGEGIPSRFDRQIPVPGLADMARPPFVEVGTEKSGSTARRSGIAAASRLTARIPKSCD